jgi:hypothetical protein
MIAEEMKSRSSRRNLFLKASEFMGPGLGLRPNRDDTFERITLLRKLLPLKRKWI